MYGTEAKINPMKQKVEPNNLLGENFTKLPV